MDLEIIVLNKVSQRKTNMIISYIQILKNNTNEFIYKIETGSQIWKINLHLPKRMGRGVWN